MPREKLRNAPCRKKRRRLPPARMPAPESPARSRRRPANRPLPRARLGPRSRNLRPGAGNARLARRRSPRPRRGRRAPPAERPRAPPARGNSQRLVEGVRRPREFSKDPGLPGPLGRHSSPSPGGRGLGVRGSRIERLRPTIGRGGRFYVQTAGLLAAWAALVLAWSYIARDVLPVSRREFWPSAIARRAPPLARYDSGWYLTILERGYGPAPAPGQQSAHAFFPLYPYLARGVRALVPVDGFVAGQILSLFCFLAAGLLFASEGRRRLGERGSRHAMFFLLLYPTAFFLVAMYSESLFLLLSLAAFREARRDRPATAAVLGLLAGSSRLRPRSDRRALARALLAGLAPVAGVLLWVFGAGWAAGEPGLFFRVQEAWHRGASPWLGVQRFVQGLPSRIARGDARDHPAFLLDYAHLLLFAAIAVYQTRRRLFSDAAWTAGALLLPIASGIAASLPRYVLVVYPAFYALAQFFEERPRIRLAWWIFSGLLLAAGEAAFVHWRWVA